MGPGGRRPWERLAARAGPVPVVGAVAPAAGRAGDPGRHRLPGLLRPRRLHRQQRPDRPGQPGRLHLLHDGHAEHDRVRRHRAVQGRRPPDQRLRHHPAPHRLPGAADRDHPRGARLAGPGDVPDLTLEEAHGPPRRRRRLRHQGSQRGRDPGQQRAGPRVGRDRRPGAGGDGGRARRRAGGGHRRRHPPRGAAARRRRARPTR